MTRTTVKCLCVFAFLVGIPRGADAAIEIVAGGTKFASMEEYRAARLAALESRQRRIKRGIKDFKTVAKPSSRSAAITPQTSLIWRRLGYENGVRRVQVDFRQSWNNPDIQFVIASSELEDRLKALADGRKEPLLFMANRNKLRVMALEQDGRPRLE